MKALLPVLLAALAWPASASAQIEACRTEWEQHDGEGLVVWGFDMGTHGNIAEYDYATIPDPDGAGWGPAPNGQSIDYNLNENSTLCGNAECRYAGEFTYFKTHIYLPPQLVFTEAWVDVTLVDDGVRMTVFSPTYPAGVTDPGGYAFLGGGVSSDLLPYMSDDPYSVVVLTHVDDCCSQSLIEGVDFYVYVDGRPEAVPTDCDIVDDDGDGYPEAGGDCDDSDPNVFPGQTETENGIDDDCDGVVDDGTNAFDDDGDGLSENDGDCDDGNPNVSPAAEEECGQTSVDFDCDGCIGDDDPDCGGDCDGEFGDDDDASGGDDDDDGADDDDDDDAFGDDDDGGGDGGGTTGQAAGGCSCFDQSLSGLPLVVVLGGGLGLRRRRQDR